METIRILYLLLTIWTTAVGWAWAQQSLGAPPPTIATLDLTVAANYPEFITTMRNKLSEKDKKGNDVLLCTMKKISETVPSPPYAYVDIKAPGTQTITLAIERKDIYVMGYRDKFNGEDRAFFFKDKEGKTDSLFPNAQGKKNRIIFDYEGQYTSLGDRSKVPLGIKDFRKSITDIYGQPTSKDFVPLQKNFFLLALQMVAEATRFKYISDNIPIEKDYETLKVDEKVIALENGWGKLSTSIYEATSSKDTPTKCKLKRPVSLDLKGQDKWTFNSVEEIEAVVGLLKAKGNKKSPTNNDDDNNIDNDNGVIAVASS